MFFVGVEHGTRSIRTTIIDNLISDNELFIKRETEGGQGEEPTTSSSKHPVNFELRRDGGEDFPFLTLLERCVDPGEIGLLCMTYSMGDDFSEILPLKSLKNRGIKPPGGTGRITGTGSRIFDEIQRSSLPALAVPGMHRDSGFIHPYFKLLFSHSGAPDKVCSTYASYRYLRGLVPPPYRHDDISFINADVGANTVSTIVVNGRIIGAMDACCGAPGLSMGPLDLEAMRRVDRRERSASDAFEMGGVFRGKLMEQIRALAPSADTHYSDKVIYNIIEKMGGAEEKLRTLAFSVAMEIKGLGIFSPVDAVIITGAGADITRPVNFRELVEGYLEEKQVFSLNHYSASKGAALMAREIYRRFKERTSGQTNENHSRSAAIDILGVPVNTYALERMLSPGNSH